MRRVIQSKMHEVTTESAIKDAKIQEYYCVRCKPNYDVHVDFGHAEHAYYRIIKEHWERVERNDNHHHYQ